MHRPDHREADRPSWTPRLLIGGALLVALALGSIVGVGSNAPGGTYCYTSCSMTVSITSSAVSVGAGGSITFQAAITGGTAPFTYSWNFGDGSAVSTSPSPQHTFSSQGSFDVVLTVQDSSGLSAKSGALVIAVGPCTSNCNNQNVNPSGGSSALSGADIAAIVAAIIIIVVVAVLAVLLLRRRKATAAGAAVMGGGAAYYAEPPPTAPPQVGAAYIDPTSMEPPAAPPAGPGGMPLPPPPSSDDVAHPGPMSAAPPPPY